MTDTAPRAQPERARSNAALCARDVLEHFRIVGETAGDEFHTRMCPACGQRRGPTVTVSLLSGRWSDRLRGCSGDLLALIASLAGLDAIHDNERVLELAAEIAGKAAR